MSRYFITTEADQRLLMAEAKRMLKDTIDKHLNDLKKKILAAPSNPEHMKHLYFAHRVFNS